MSGWLRGEGVWGAGLHLWLELGPAFKNGWSWAWLSWMAGYGPACKDGWKWAQLLVMAAVKPGFNGWLEVARLAWMGGGGQLSRMEVGPPCKDDRRWSRLHVRLEVGTAFMDGWLLSKLAWMLKMEPSCIDDWRYRPILHGDRRWNHLALMTGDIGPSCMETEDGTILH